MGSKKHKKHKYERRDRPLEAIVERGAEPLRLVLKVGGSSASEHGDSPHIQPHPDVYQEDRSYRLIGEKHKKSKKKKKKKSSDREKKHKHHHHHHEKKEKRKREREEYTQDESEATMDHEDSQEPPAKQAMYEEESVPERLYREPRACTLKNRQGKSALQRLLDHLLKSLELKDPQQFFAWPVTDNIAPGYSSIIAHPMDFSTMRTKTDNNEYSSVSDFMDDIRLLCDNCMTYNRPDTIYHKTAKRMLHFGSKLISKEKILLLKNTLPFISELTSEELGFEHEEEPPRSTLGELGPSQDENSPVTEMDKIRKLSVNEIEYDGMTGEEILAQARKAARAAADKLTLRRPSSKFGFLRQQNDGSTSLAIINPSNVWSGTDSKENIKEERKITLEMLVGKLQQGTGSLAGFKEDKRNIIKPVNYLNYGNFGSYAPTYDSIFANVTKEESDLIYSTYGDETCVQYAESLFNFTKDCEFASEMADSVLDSLTDGEHRKLMKSLDLKKNTETTNGKSDGLNGSEASNMEFDYDSLKTLKDEGIDISFLDTIVKQVKKDPIQKKLDETTNLLQDLVKVQHDRLSAKLPTHLSQIAGPSVEELEIGMHMFHEDLTKSLLPLKILHFS
ncbi:hypothetical protein CHUAL_011834 [Chamberlinius hualienensis]